MHFTPIAKYYGKNFQIVVPHVVGRHVTRSFFSPLSLFPYVEDNPVNANDEENRSHKYHPHEGQITACLDKFYPQE